MKGKKVVSASPDPKYVEAATKITPLVDAILLDPEFVALAEDPRFLRLAHVVQTVLDMKVNYAKRRGARIAKSSVDGTLFMLGWVAGKKDWLNLLSE